MCPARGPNSFKISISMSLKIASYVDFCLCNGFILSNTISRVSELLSLLIAVKTGWTIVSAGIKRVDLFPSWTQLSSTNTNWWHSCFILHYVSQIFDFCRTFKLVARQEVLENAPLYVVKKKWQMLSNVLVRGLWFRYHWIVQAFWTVHRWQSVKEYQGYLSDTSAWCSLLKRTF